MFDGPTSCSVAIAALASGLLQGAEPDEAREPLAMQSYLVREADRWGVTSSASTGCTTERT